MKFRLLIDFESEVEMYDYLLNVKRSTLKKVTKSKESDMRGSKTTELHRKAKEYKSSHPETPYKECLSVVSHPEVKPETKSNEVIEEFKQEVKVELIEEVNKNNEIYEIF